MGKYFDWAATGVPDSDIIHDALNKSIANFGNPSSVHNMGKDAREIITATRKSIASVLNIDPKQLYFTSGGTESNQLILTSLIARPTRGTILVSSIEHPSVLYMARNMKSAGFTVKEIPCNKMGIVTSDALKDSLTADTLMVCIMAVNNETGAINDIKALHDVLHSQSGRIPHFHCDMVQALGKIPLNLSYVDSASFSAHKIGGARGIGMLYTKKPMQMFLTGGGQEENIRSGTENLFGIIALGMCVEKHVKSTNTQVLMDYFIDALKDVAKSTIIPSTRTQNKDNYSPYIIQVAFNDIPGEVLVRSLSDKGYYISSGSACNNNSNHKRGRYVLQAMGVSDNLAKSAVRFSFGYDTTKSDIDNLVATIKDVTQTL